MPLARVETGVWYREAVLLALYAALAIQLTWPLARDLGGGIPLGSETVATVPLVSLWSLWWNADRLAHGYAGYWDAPIFHPAEGAFAFSEAHVLNGLLAAVLAPLTGSLPAAYNLLLLLSLTLNGWLAYRLLRTLSPHPVPAVGGGLLVALLPFVHQELGVLALVPLGGILAALLATVRFVRRPRPSTGCVLGLAVGATYLLCGYYGLMTGLLLALTVPFLLLGRLREPRLWQGLVATAVVTAVLVLPVALPQQAAARRHGFERSEETVGAHSARPGHYLRAAWPAWLPAPGGEASRPSSRAFWPGTLRVLLALTGLLWALRRTEHRRWVLWLAVLGLLGFVLSLGPNGAIGHGSVHGLVEAMVPGYEQMRSLFRFAVVVQLAVVLLAAFGLEAVRKAVAERGRRAGLAAVVVLAALAAAELWPRMGEIQPLPPLDLELEWVRWIESETSADAVLAFVPFPEGRTSTDYLGTAQWMYWQMRHGRPMVNGYSSFFPRSFRTLKRQVRGFPDARSISRLAADGVRYCIVHRAFVAAGTLDGATDGGWRLEHMASDEDAAIDVYALRDYGVPDARGRGGHGAPTCALRPSDSIRSDSVRCSSSSPAAS